jgi:hypothetical protein
MLKLGIVMVAIDLCDGVQNQRAGNMGGKCGRWQG